VRSTTWKARPLGSRDSLEYSITSLMIGMPTTGGILSERWMKIPLSNGFEDGQDRGGSTPLEPVAEAPRGGRCWSRNQMMSVSRTDRLHPLNENLFNDESCHEDSHSLKTTVGTQVSSTCSY
jgi:hypothetical protein